MEPDEATIIVHERQPYNAGPHPAVLAEALVTPTEHFFVRSHGDVPVVERAAYRLRVEGLVRTPLALSLDDLGGFERVTQAATLQCAGNRRDELLAVGEIPGELPWGGEAVGTALWSGVRLADVLRAAGMRDGARHVAFTGLDELARDDGVFPFGGSIPLDKALDPSVLLADTMNDAPLPAQHGAPLRVVAPGYIGARSVKWVGAITVQAEPSANYFQAHAYRLARGCDEPGDMLGELFVSALITTPADGATIDAGRCRVRGYALCGGDAYVERVELSHDGGSTWCDTALIGEAARGVWRLWQADIALERGEHELVVRAYDSVGRGMPATLTETWNTKGYMNNAWHRRRITAR
jgi:sulfite oxidase